jgi:uncharacterized protein (DUF1778 family)
MHASRREKTLTEYISARVTQQEGERIRECAEAAGLTRSEWCRQVVLSAIDTPAQTQLLLSEFLALRTLVLALHTETLNGNKITEQRIAAMIQHVEAKKFALAENRIRAFQSQPKSHAGNAGKS